MPEAIFVKHQAASNWNFGIGWWSSSINKGIKFASMTAWIGGFPSIESSFLSPTHANSF